MRTATSARPTAALVWLFGRSTRQAGLWIARLYAVLGGLSTVVAVLWIAERYGPDDASVTLAARGCAAIVWVAGGIAAYTLAQRGRDADEHVALCAIAHARGFDHVAVLFAEALACARRMAEVVLVPVVGIAGFVWLLVVGGRVERAAAALIGLASFGVVATVVLGLVAGCCRIAGGRFGRLWLLVAMLGPWALSDLVLSGYGDGWLSIPGWLEHAYRWSTMA